MFIASICTRAWRKEGLEVQNDRAATIKNLPQDLVDHVEDLTLVENATEEVLENEVTLTLLD